MIVHAVKIKIENVDRNSAESTFMHYYTYFYFQNLKGDDWKQLVCDIRGCYYVK